MSKLFCTSLFGAGMAFTMASTALSVADVVLIITTTTAAFGWLVRKIWKMSQDWNAILGRLETLQSMAEMQSQKIDELSNCIGSQQVGLATLEQRIDDCQEEHSRREECHTPPVQT